MMVWWIVFFFVVGIALLLAEFVLPGLICGVIGGTFVAISCMIALYWHPEHAFLIIVGEIMGTVLALIAGFYVVARSPLGRAMVLHDTQNAASGWVSDESDEQLLGTTGTVFTALRPAGTIVVKGKKLNAISSGDFIDDGTLIKVIEVSGNRIVVEPASKG